MSKPAPVRVDTFQDLILALQRYWATHGCVILQPYDMEMGAGTFHPATFLRGHPQALARRHSGSLPRLARGAGHRSPRARHPLRRGQLGVAHPGGLGTGLGGLAQWHGSHPVHLFPAGRRTGLPSG